MTKTQLILDLYDIKAIKFGQFTLKSGRLSPFYIDLRILAGEPRVLRGVASHFVRALRKLTFQRLAAIPYTGLVLGTAVATAGSLPMVFPRREAKSYGTGRQIEGNFRKGERVVILDDVITDGASKFETIEVLEAAGLRVRDLLVLIDRQEGGGQMLARRGYTLHRIFTIEQVFDILTKNRVFSSRQRQVLGRRLAEYQKAYGAG